MTDFRHDKISFNLVKSKHTLAIKLADAYIEIESLRSDNEFQADVMYDMGEIILENKNYKLKLINVKLNESLEKALDAVPWDSDYFEGEDD